MPENTVSKDQRRVQRGQDTISKMIAMYCRAKHTHAQGLCPECAALQAYTQARVAACMFQPEKPSCNKCPVHCYSPSRRAQIREVMRFAGPRMLWRHPIAAGQHLLLVLQKPSLRVRELSKLKTGE